MYSSTPEGEVVDVDEESALVTTVVTVVVVVLAGEADVESQLHAGVSKCPFDTRS